MNFFIKLKPYVRSRERDFSHEATNDPYEILGIKKSSSEEDIREAYKTLVAKYHPDKVSHLGREFQDLAHKKFIAIQKAYDELIIKNKN